MLEDIERILGYTAMMAKGYDNHMKWNEEAKLRSDMMRRGPVEPGFNRRR
ncbi:hypothetical protein [Atopobium sp. oral taxon 810]|nr:hypothetical protein [Atopobium sp. oral taxon 810]ERI03839.1 hypothetical protein HMPREF9069_01900 [Atopobium sp. oral taxon 810 str. F0209]